MHELKELVHNSFQELPVGSKKTRVLANNVHDVRGDDGLVVFSSLLLTETQQILKQTPKDSHLGLMLSLMGETIINMRHKYE